MAYDPEIHQLVLVGGINSTGQLNGQTWLWNGRTWSRSPAAAPSDGEDSALAYDAASKQLILFGGANQTGGVSDETWIWTGTRWKRLSPKMSPPAMAGGVDGLTS
jgi:hypothetical protein